MRSAAAALISPFENHEGPGEGGLAAYRAISIIVGREALGEGGITSRAKN